MSMPESILGREIFGPLGGMVEIGAVVAQGAWTLSDVSVGEFVARRRGELDQLLRVVRDIGDFAPATMGIVDELGYVRDHEVTAPSLLLWSGGYENVSPRLGEAVAVRRMSRTGGDLQVTNFLHALVNAAIERGSRESSKALN
ncbi:hypothetical protein AB0M87_01080 [Streptomyces sp. NPDC051320]|uniref:hypothetical protein n=1 Tax=Streptomyces sp. NPDC051320 TaxID=3154644 RepID=UPI0034186F37